MKFLKTILALFTNNIGLKLVALLLAVAVYCAIRLDRTHNQDNTAHDRPIIQLP